MEITSLLKITRRRPGRGGMSKEWFQMATTNGWRSEYAGSAASGGDGAFFLTYTTIALLIIMLCHFAKRVYPFFVAARSSVKPPLSPSANRLPRIAEIVSDTDLKTLVDSLDEKISGNEKWERVVDKKRNNLTYTAKCCKQKDEPLKYMSATVFGNCSNELLKDFYMDNDYRVLWDKTVLSHEQLQVDESNGTEIGRTIKKFPLLTPREYVLAWRLWEGKDKTFYCFIKDCKHPLAPQKRKYVRVGFFRSSWRIKKVPGRNACEIKVIHQEDAGLNVEMARLAFSKGIWSYVCKTDDALRQYSASHSSQRSSMAAPVNIIQKVPPGLEVGDALPWPVTVPISHDSGAPATSEDSRKKKPIVRWPSGKAITKGLLVMGGLLCLFQARPSLRAKLAMACRR